MREEVKKNTILTCLSPPPSLSLSHYWVNEKQKKNMWKTNLPLQFKIPKDCSHVKWEDMQRERSHLRLQHSQSCLDFVMTSPTWVLSNVASLHFYTSCKLAMHEVAGKLLASMRAGAETRLVFPFLNSLTNRVNHRVSCELQTPRWKQTFSSSPAQPVHFLMNRLNCRSSYSDSKWPKKQKYRDTGQTLENNRSKQEFE